MVWVQRQLRRMKIEDRSERGAGTAGSRLRSWTGQRGGQGQRGQGRGREQGGTGQLHAGTMLGPRSVINAVRMPLPAACRTTWQLTSFSTEHPNLTGYPYTTSTCCMQDDLSPDLILNRAS